VIEELNNKEHEIEEICVVYKTKAGVRRIVHGSLEDNFEWYGVMTGLAHNMFMHNAGQQLIEE